MRELKILSHFTWLDYWGCSIVRIEESDSFASCRECDFHFIPGCVALSLLYSYAFLPHYYCKNCLTSDTPIARRFIAEDRSIDWRGFTCDANCEALHLTWVSSRSTESYDYS